MQMAAKWQNWCHLTEQMGTRLYSKNVQCTSAFATLVRQLHTVYYVVRDASLCFALIWSAILY